MSLTATLLKRKQTGNLIALVQLVPTGSYITGGDAVDFGPLVGQNRKPDQAVITGIAGYIYQWDKTNNKVQVRGSAATAGAALAEFTSGAYSAALTADTVIARLEWIAIPNNG